MARQQKERKLALEWLKGFLASGPRSTSEIKAATQADGRFSFPTLQRSRAAYPVYLFQSNKQWFWTLEPPKPPASSSKPLIAANTSSRASNDECDMGCINTLRETARYMASEKGSSFDEISQELHQLHNMCPADPPFSDLDAVIVSISEYAIEHKSDSKLNVSL